MLRVLRRLGAAVGLMACSGSVSGTAGDAAVTDVQVDREAPVDVSVMDARVDREAPVDTPADDQGVRDGDVRYGMLPEGGVAPRCGPEIDPTGGRSSFSYPSAVVVPFGQTGLDGSNYEIDSEATWVGHRSVAPIRVNGCAAEAQGEPCVLTQALVLRMPDRSLLELVTSLNSMDYPRIPTERPVRVHLVRGVLQGLRGISLQIDDAQGRLLAAVMVSGNGLRSDWDIGPFHFRMMGERVTCLSEFWPNCFQVNGVFPMEVTPRGAGETFAPRVIPTAESAIIETSRGRYRINNRQHWRRIETRCGGNENTFVASHFDVIALYAQ